MSGLSAHQYVMLLKWQVGGGHKKERNHSAWCPRHSISLKAVKVLCLKKGMMNVHYPFIMHEATNCFCGLCSATRKVMNIWKAWGMEEHTGISPPPPNITHTAQSQRVFLWPSPWQFTIIICPECHLRWGKTRFPLQKKQSESSPWILPHGISSHQT